MAKRVKSFRIDRKAYVRGYEYYSCDFGQNELEYLQERIKNTIVLKEGELMPQITIDDVLSVVQENPNDNLGQEYEFKYSSIAQMTYHISLAEFIRDFINEMAWDNCYDTDTEIMECDDYPCDYVYEDDRFDEDDDVDNTPPAHVNE